MRIRLETDPSLSFIQGRNGLAPIKSVELWIDDMMRVWIDGISRRNKVVNGGLCLSATSMDKLCLEWLKERGKLPA